MSSVTINGTAVNDFSTAWGGGSLADGTYYATGEDPRFGEPPAETAPENDRRAVAFPGVDGQGEKDFGFRRRTIWIDLVFVGTLSGASAAKASLLSSLYTNTRYSVVLPDATRQGCKLREAGRARQFSLDGKVVICVPLVFAQLSETN